MQENEKKNPTVVSTENINSENPKFVQEFRRMMVINVCFKKNSTKCIQNDACYSYSYCMYVMM